MHWHHIGILGKLSAAAESITVLQKVFTLLQQWQITVYCEVEVGKLLNCNAENCFSAEALVQRSDLILVVGGDGSMLNAARLAVLHDKPVLGINRGQLGFLTDISPAQLEDRLYKTLQGSFWIEERHLLAGEILQQTTKKIQQIALNEIVLSLGISAQLLSFSLWINDCFVCQQRADGLIISTPTGSTAYALSAGGPILHPELNAIAIVAMLPHRLSSRPIVVDNSAQIKIELKKSHPHPARVSFDSHHNYELHNDETLNINLFSKKLHLVHPKDYDYFQTLRDKLYWENN